MWDTKKLEDLLIKKESGKRPKGGVSKYNSGTPSVGAEHLNNSGDFDFSNIKYVPDVFAKNMNRGQIETGDLLVVKDGATTGKISLVKENFPFGNAVINEHIILCRVRDDINNKFVFYNLWSQNGQKEILKDFRGAAQGGISQGFSEKVEIPLPPLSTQHRIVEKIEELFSELDNGVENLKRAWQQLKTYRQAVLKDAFEGKLTASWREQQDDLPTPEELLKKIKAERNAHRQRQLAEWEKEVEQWEKDGEPGRKPRKPMKSRNVDELSVEEVSKLHDLPENWYWGKINDLTSRVEYGTSNKSLDNGQIPVLRMGNMQNGSIDWADLKYSNDPDDNQEYLLEEGDVLFNRTNSPELVGKAVIYKGERPAIFAGYLIRLNHIRSLVNGN